MLIALVACHDAAPSTKADAGVAAATPLAWQTVLQNLDGTLLSVWGTSATDVWSVGGSLGDGLESLVMHYDGLSWTRRHPGGNDSFWWVHGTTANDVWMVGEHGRITHWDGAAFADTAPITDATVFGVFAVAPNDVWAVGGTPGSATGTNDVVLHYDGTSWKASALPVQNHVALFKIWGTDANNLYVVGENGVIWHRVQGAWNREAAGLATGRLTTVFGCSATEVYAVGGRDLLVSDGATWKRADIDPTLIVNDLNGVSCSSAGVIVVGGGSLKLRYVQGADAGPTKRWETDFGVEPFVDLHGAWADPSGAFWGAGGQFTAAAQPNLKRDGVLAFYGRAPISTLVSGN